MTMKQRPQQIQLYQNYCLLIFLSTRKYFKYTKKIKKNILTTHLPTTLSSLIKVFHMQTFYHIYFRYFKNLSILPENQHPDMCHLASPYVFMLELQMPVSAKYIVALSAGEGYINDTTAGTTGQHFLRLNLNYSVTCLPVSLCPCTDFSMIYLELDQLGHRVVTDIPDAGKLLHKGAMPPRPPTFHISANTSYCSQT